MVDYGNTDYDDHNPKNSIHYCIDSFCQKINGAMKTLKRELQKYSCSQRVVDMFETWRGNGIYVHKRYLALTFRGLLQALYRTEGRVINWKWRSREQLIFYAALLLGCRKGTIFPEHLDGRRYLHFLATLWINWYSLLLAMKVAFDVHTRWVWISIRRGFVTLPFLET